MPALLAVLLVVLLGVLPGWSLSRSSVTPPPTGPAAPLVAAAEAAAGPGETAAPQAAVGTASAPLPQSSESLARRSPWSRPASYPLQRRPRSDLYRPSADWIGRLILPSRQELTDPQAPAGDWVWIVLEQTPADQQDRIGRRQRLTWAEDPALQRLVRTVTTDIRFGQSARLAASQGNVVPDRLDGRDRVGPLQSLAGARPDDDVIVSLEGVETTAGSAAGSLRISRPPLQISGRWQGLVQIVGPIQREAAAPADLWQVRHFNRASGRFDGASETIRIPLLPRNRYGRRMLDPSGLAASPLNREGWLIQGAPAADGLFTVQALEPRRLLTPTPQRRIVGTAAGLAELQRGSWSPPMLRRGSLQHTLLLPDGTAPPDWRPGQRALLIHLFGGIGGVDGEPVAGWTATGHFAFGEARLETDPFSGQPRLAIRYHQIYANNPDGIVAGSQDWSAYAGNLQRGWLGTRPFSDVLIPAGDAVLDAIGLQAEVLAARYRSGDGAGVALVTAATSCVQDSAQALWIALRSLQSSPAGSGLPAAERQRLERLGRALDHLLTPFGRVRSDWAHNSRLALEQGQGRFLASQSLGDVLLSWRSLLPRGAHDTLAAELLRAGLPLQVLRTNQIPGQDPRLEPMAPTTLLGQLPLAGTLVARLGDALFPPPLAMGRLWPLLILAVYAPLALAVGHRDGFLPRRWIWPPPLQLLRRAAGYAVMPAFVEELLFRALLLPSPMEGAGVASTLAWIALSTGLFVLYHPLSARLWYPSGRPLFADPRFLGQCSLLGLACGLAFCLSGSLWWAVLLHWLAVLIWLEPLQGRRRLGIAAPGDGGAAGPVSASEAPLLPRRL